MFLHTLDPNNQELFAQAAMRLSSRDGEESAEEAFLIDTILAECDLEKRPETLTMAQVVKKLRDEVTDEYARRVFLLELAGIAEIDGEASEAELTMLAQAAEALDLTDEFVERSREFARKAQALMLDGKVLLASEVSA